MNQNLNNILKGARDIVSGKVPGIAYHRQAMIAAQRAGRGGAKFVPIKTETASAPSEAVLTEHTVDTNGDVVSRVVVAKAKRTYYLYEDGVVSQRKRPGIEVLGSIRATTTDEAAVLFGGVK